MIRTRNDSRFQAFEVPCERRGLHVKGWGISMGHRDSPRWAHRNVRRVSFSVRVLQDQWAPLVLLASSRVVSCFLQTRRFRSVRPSPLASLRSRVWHKWPAKGWIGWIHTSGDCCCFLDLLSADFGCLGSTSGIPNRAARALRFSSSGSSSSTVGSAGAVVEVVVDISSGSGANS